MIVSPTALDGGELLCITIGWISLKLWVCGHLSILSIYQYYMLGVYSITFFGIAYKKCIPGHIIIPHNVSWLHIVKWVMHISVERSRDRVDTILKNPPLLCLARTAHFQQVTPWRQRIQFNNIFNPWFCH